jgi:hypothetical protein
MFSEMLDEAINRYNNRSLTSAEIIAELVTLACHPRTDWQAIPGSSRCRRRRRRTTTAGRVGDLAFAYLDGQAYVVRLLVTELSASDVLKISRLRCRV